MKRDLDDDAHRCAIFGTGPGPSSNANGFPSRSRNVAWISCPANGKTSTLWLRRTRTFPRDIQAGSLLEAGARVSDPMA